MEVFDKNTLTLENVLTINNIILKAFWKIKEYNLELTKCFPVLQFGIK